MKRTLTCLLLACVLCALCGLPAFAETAEPADPEQLFSANCQYVLLADGTARITKYTGSEEVLTIPASLDEAAVTAIGDRAFSSCAGLTAVSIPDSVVSVGANPFAGCKNLSEVTVSPDHPALEVVGGVLFSKTDKRLIWYPMTAEAEEYAVPDGTEIIGDSAFESCGRLTSVTIPDSVVTVGSNPFRYCGKLAGVVVSPDHPALEVSGGALLSKADKRLVFYPMAAEAKEYAVPEGTEVIGDSAFFYCRNLTSVTLPDGLKSIGDEAFSWCSGLTGIDIPGTVRRIGDSAFSYCRGLTSFAFPDGVVSIGQYAFFFCRGLTSVTIPDSVAVICRSAFDSCNALADVNIPDSVVFIGDSAFYGCTPLTALTVPASVAVIEKEAFDNDPNLTLTVFSGSAAEAYCKKYALNCVLAGE